MYNGQGFKLKYEATSNGLQMTYGIGECGGSFATPKGLLTSPLFPDKYPDNADCVYTISQSSGTYFLLTFHRMGIETEDSCSYDYLEIRDGFSDGSPVLGKLCGNDIPAPIQSTQNQVWIR